MTISTSSIDKISHWNIIDSMIFSVENLISKLVAEAKESRDELPDPEEMIAAATKELQEENNELMQYRRPGQLIKLDKNYACPNCKTELSNPSKYKYCPECGKRIVVPKAYPYNPTENNSNPVL